MKILNLKIINKNKYRSEDNNIDNIDRDNYINKRLNNQIEWYETRSKQMKKKFSLISSIIIIVNAIIPIFVLLSEEFGLKFKVIVILLSSIASISTTMLQLFKYQELWLKYRVTSQLLIKEKISYETETNKYKNNTEALELLIVTCEEIMEKEIDKWEKMYNSNV